MSRKRGVFDKLVNDEGLSPGARDAAASIGEYLRQIGRTGGQSRARRHGHDELSKWGRVRHQKAASDSSPPNS